MAGDPNKCDINNITSANWEDCQAKLDDLYDNIQGLSKTVGEIVEIELAMEMERIE